MASKSREAEPPQKSRSRETEPLLDPKSTQTELDDATRTGRRRRAVWALTLVIMTYFLSYYLSVLILNPYLYDLVSEEMNHTKKSSSEKPCAENTGNSTNTTDNQIQVAVQKKVTTLELYISLPSLPCAALSVLIVGPLTDKYGRKLGFLFPIVGTLLKQIIYAFAIKARLPPMVLIAGHICECIGGSFAAMLTAMFTVISDITHPGSQRSFHIAIMEALQTMMGAGCGYIIGQWIKYSYFYPLVCSVCLCCASLFLALFLLPETSVTNRLMVPRAASCVGCCSQLKHNLGKALGSGFRMFKRSFLLFKTGQSWDHLVAKRRLCILVFILTVAVNFSAPGIQTLYLMKYPRCWSATTVLTFGSIVLVCNWVAILLLMKLMQKVFKMADRHIAMIGVVSSVTFHAFMSLATNNVMVYEAAVTGIMIRVVIPMLRSVMSSVVEKTDQGAVYAIMGCVETLGGAVFQIITNRVYNATLAVWDGSVFVIFAGIMVFALGGLILLNILFSRDQERGPVLVQHSQTRNIQDESDSSW